MFVHIVLSFFVYSDYIWRLPAKAFYARFDHIFKASIFYRMRYELGSLQRVRISRNRHSCLPYYIQRKLSNYITQPQTEIYYYRPLKFKTVFPHWSANILILWATFPFSSVVCQTGSRRHVNSACYI